MCIPWRMLWMFAAHASVLAAERALLSAGRRIEINNAMIPMTTSSSTSVNACRAFRVHLEFTARGAGHAALDGMIVIRDHAAFLYQPQLPGSLFRTSLSILSFRGRRPHPGHRKRI